MESIDYKGINIIDETKDSLGFIWDSTILTDLSTKLSDWMPSRPRNVSGIHAML